MVTQKLAVPVAPPPFVALRRPAAGRPVPDRPPVALDCLRCQLAGRRRTTCALSATCARLPLFFPLAPLLLVGWVGSVLAFLLTL